MKRMSIGWSGLVLAVWLLAVPLQAAGITWGGGTGNWDVAANWLGGVLPVAGDMAVIDSGRPSINVTLSPAPDVIRVDAGGTAFFTASNANDFVLNGGTIASLGDPNPVVSGDVLLTADSVIQNTHGNSNRSFTMSGAVSEDTTPRKLTLTGYPATAGGSALDRTNISAANTYSGGTDVLGATNYITNLGGLGTGPVNIPSGRLVLSVSGDYTHGTISVTGGSLIVGSTVTNEVWDLCGGSLTYDHSPRKVDATNTITISSTSNIVAGGGYYGNAFSINTGITGPGKAVLNDAGSTSNSILSFGAVQNWTGGTDVKGIVSVTSGGQLPAGTLSVYPAGYSAGSGLLRLSTGTSLNIGTDLVLLRDAGSGTCGTIMMAANQMVNSLTIDGAVIPAGVYTQADFPDYVVGSGSYTLTVLNPDTPPSAIADLVAGNPQLTSVALTWSAPRDAMNPGNAATSYDIRYSTDPVSDASFAAATPVPQNLVPAAPDSAESFTVTGLNPATTYYFAIKSVDLGSNISGLSNLVTADTLIPDVTAPAAVTDLRVVDINNRSLTLAWTTTGDDGTTGTASTYDIRMSTDPIDDANFASAAVVAQGLAPSPAGQTETFVVTGLTPGTTYHFAMKVADETPNWSALSNVVEQATLPPDVTAPASVTDLTAGGSDAFSATLTWTSSGDDANTGTATLYEVRYSTAMIDEAGWSSANVVLNVPTPQVAGSTETFVVPALQPSMTYYFALKVADEEGNTSGLSNVASFTTAPLPPLPVVTSLTIVEKAGVTTTNYPVTLSMVFRKGDVADNVIARVDGAAFATQTDVKVRWPDGSVRHALVSFILPSLQADSQVTVELLAGGLGCNTTGMTKDQLLASDFEANMAITVAGTTTNVSARQILQNTADPRYWAKGAIVSEFVLRDWNTNVAGQLNVSYRVRVYPTAGYIRVSTVVDNDWVDARGNITYDFTLSLGLSNPQVVFSKTDFTQWHDSRWHKVFWQGLTPPQIEVRYDLPYLASTGAVPNYDSSLVVSATAITNQYNTWNATAHDIMDGGGLTKYFPTTGGRDEIGPYPRFASLYLCSMDYRMAEVTINYGDLSGTCPMHFRESDPARSFYQHPIKVDDRPTIWTTQVDVGYIKDQFIAKQDQFPPAVGDLTDPWTVELPHQPSLAYIPYLMTGDLYYLEEMQFWACFDLGASNWQYRGGTKCWIVEQIRGNAWAFRNIVDAAAMTPADMPERAYLEEKIANNIERWKTVYIANANWPTVRSYSSGGYTGESSIDQTACGGASGIWQDDYLTWSFLHALQQGYPALDLAHWGGKGVIDRFTDWRGWDRFRGAPYAMPVRGKDAEGNPAPYLTWADVHNGFSDKTFHTSFGGDGTNPNSYTAAARGLICLVSNIGNGPAVSGWFREQMPVSVFAGDPRWAFAPQYKAGDADLDGYVNVGDLQALAAAWGSGYGSAGFIAAADLNADLHVNVGDLQTLVANWDQ